jgi:Ni/Co efflux regulator RcnB
MTSRLFTTVAVIAGLAAAPALAQPDQQQPQHGGGGAPQGGQPHGGGAPHGGGPQGGAPRGGGAPHGGGVMGGPRGPGGPGPGAMGGAPHPMTAAPTGPGQTAVNPPPGGREERQRGPGGREAFQRGPGGREEHRGFNGAPGQPGVNVPNRPGRPGMNAENRPGQPGMNAGNRSGGRAGWVARHGNPAQAGPAIRRGSVTARGGRFTFEGRTFNRVHAPRFHYPRGYGYRRWGVGARLPWLFLTPTFFFTDYSAFGFPPPPYGEEWVRYGPDLLLVDLDTGEVVYVIYGAFY